MIFIILVSNIIKIDIKLYKLIDTGSMFRFNKTLKNIRLIYKINKRFISNENIIVNRLKEHQQDNLNLVEQILKYSTSTFMFPFGFYTCKANHIGIIYRFGKYDGYILPGFGWVHPFSTSLKEIFCGDKPLTFNNITMTDLNKNPIIISSNVSYKIINPLKFTLNIENENVIGNLIENNLRLFLSKYTYNDLTSDTIPIINKFISEINENKEINEYGINIVNAGIIKISYAPEIIESLLIKQKAKATIEAKKELVDVTIQLIDDISNKLNKELLPEDKSKLITYLTVSMLGQSTPVNTINLN